MYNEVKRKPTTEKNAGLYIKLGSINATVGVVGKVLIKLAKQQIAINT